MDKEQKRTIDMSWSAGKNFRQIIALLLLVLTPAAGLYLWFRPNADDLTREVKQAVRDGDIHAAVESAQQLVALKPESVDAWKLLVDAGRLAEDRSVWEEALAKLEELDSTAAYEHWLKIGTDEMLDLHAAAAEYALRQAIGVSRERPEPWRLLAQLLSVQGRPRETSECLLSLIRLNSFTRGDLLTLGWPNSAIDDPSRANGLLQADPQNLIPMLSKVGSALNENRTADAETILNTILIRHPENSRVIALLGMLLAERDATEFTQWQHDLSAHAAMEPETLIAQGIWLKHHGQASAAAGCFHRAVELDPRHLNALSELGQTMQALGEADVAKAFLERARLQQEITELSRSIEEQGDAKFMWKLIQQLNVAGRFWEAWAWCQIYANDYPRDTAAAEKLAELKSRLTPDLPRTAPEAVPGQEFAWSKLAMPDWGLSFPSPNMKSSVSTNSELRFHDEAQQLGIEFHFENGPAAGGTIAQTSGGGVAAFDYDRDGWCDLYFTQGGQDPSAAEQTAIDALFRNSNGQSFADVTSPASVREPGFSQGVAAGDINNDGFPDLYVANLGQNRLLQNNGDGTFTDVTVDSGLKQTGWTTSCAIADLNGDGSPELFSVRYAGGTEITSRVCRDASGNPGICRPTLFPAETDFVAISSGDGRFIETCEQAGLDLPDGRGFGLVIADFNDDRKPDVFVSNDQTANHLLIQDNNSSGQLRFSDQAVSSAVAFDHDGFPQACMGIASSDLNHDGRPDLYITNFANESNTLYTSQPYGGFVDSTRDARLRDPSFAMLGFGTQFMDADLDGSMDLVVLNGHILDAPEVGKPAAMLPQFFRGHSSGRFEEVRCNDPKSFFENPRIGRGLCVLDWNRDGLPDFAASCLDGNAVLATNGSETDGHWLAIELVGVNSSRDAIGTRIQLTSSDGTVRYWQATAGHGFAASNECGLHLGLGAQFKEIQLQIEWPSGEIQRFEDIESNMRLVAIEGRPALIRVEQR